MENKTKVWIIKNWQTAGIVEYEGEILERGLIKYGRYDYLHSNDYEIIREKAVAKVEILRAKKLESLRKSITKIEALKL